MLIIDKSLDSGWDFLGCEVKSHLLNELIQGLSRHIVLLGLVVIRVVDSLLDSLLKLVLLLRSLFLDCLLSLCSSSCKLILECLVLLL